MSDPKTAPAPSPASEESDRSDEALIDDMASSVWIHGEVTPAMRAEARAFVDEILSAWEADRRRADKPLDHEYRSSCGHTWTVRHTSCPTCFAEVKADLAAVEARATRAEAEVERLTLRCAQLESDAGVERSHAKLARQERDAARVAHLRAEADVEIFRTTLRDLVVWGEWIRKHVHRSPRMDEPNTGALSAARALVNPPAD